MNLGEVRETLKSPKLFGAIEFAALGDDRSVVVQIEVGINPEFDIMQYEYRVCRAIGVLFFDGEFTVAIAAGELL
jgi:hypothetical protein